MASDPQEAQTFPTRVLISIKKIKEEYKDHPAATPIPTHGSLITLSVKLLTKVSSYLDLVSFNSLFLTFSGLKNNRPAVLYNDNVLRNLYASLGLDFDRVFIRIDQPAWRPWDLPRDVKAKLHTWFFKAHKIGETTNPTAVRERFRLFYSAGCLAHMFAAEQAGLMLLNPEFNTIIPAVVTYAHLEPEAKVWDVKRLNVEFLDGKYREILNLLDSSGVYEDYAGSPLVMPFKAKVEKALKIAESLEEANERRAIELLAAQELKGLKEVDTYLRLVATDRDDENLGDDVNNVRDWGSPSEQHTLREFLSQLGSRSIFLNYLLYKDVYRDIFLQVLRRGTYESDIKFLLDWHARFLNYELTRVRANLFSSVYLGGRVTDLSKPEVRSAFHSGIDCDFVSMFLGSKFGISNNQFIVEPWEDK